MAGRLRVRAGRIVKTWKTRKQELEKGRSKGRLDDKTNWQQTNREHRYKYTGNNGEDG